jgi:hypothetical protein
VPPQKSQCLGEPTGATFGEGTESKNASQIGRRILSGRSCLVKQESAFAISYSRSADWCLNTGHCQQSVSLIVTCGYWPLPLRHPLDLREWTLPAGGLGDQYSLGRGVCAAARVDTKGRSSRPLAGEFGGRKSFLTKSPCRYLHDPSVPAGSTLSAIILRVVPHAEPRSFFARAGSRRGARIRIDIQARYAPHFQLVRMAQGRVTACSHCCDFTREMHRRNFWARNSDDAL